MYRTKNCCCTKNKITCLLLFFIFNLVYFVFLPNSIYYCEKSKTINIIPANNFINNPENQDIKPSLPKINIKSPYAILMEYERGQILFSKNPDQRVHVSSMNKLMTALVALENAKLFDKLTISKESTETPGSLLGLEVGEKYYLEELLYAIMLTSVNDAAVAIAENIGGDEYKFVKLMNDTAIKYGLKNTVFSNSTGLYSEEQYTTAYDAALFLRNALKNQSFKRLFTTRVKPWTDKKGKTRVLTSQNKLFLTYDSIDGGKAGFNEKDKQSIIATAKKGNRILICVVLNSPEKIMYEDAVSLFEYGFNNFRTSLLVAAESPLRQVKVGDEFINLICKSDVYYTHPNGLSYIKNIVYKVPSELPVPVDSSKSAGTVEFILSDDTVIPVMVYPEKDILPKDDIKSIAEKTLKENKDIAIMLVVLIVLECILIIYNILKLVLRALRKIFVH